MREFLLNDRRIWTIRVDGDKTTVLYGSVFKRNKAYTKQHTDNLIATNYADKQIYLKLKRGYVEFVVDESLTAVDVYNAGDVIMLKYLKTQAGRDKLMALGRSVGVYPPK